MRYLVDGYNYLFRLLHKREEVRSIREDLIKEMSRLSLLAELDIILVFDSKYQPGYHTEKREHLFQLIFTDEGESADDWILKNLKISKNPRIITVVTSDKRLAMHCRNALSHTMECKDFQTFLQKKATKPKLKREEKPPLALKNPRKLSGSIEYYLTEFEKRLPPEIPKVKKSQKIKKEDAPKFKEENGESEFERWERLFNESDKD